MWRNVLCAAVLTVLCIGIAAADTIKGRITKVEGNKITVATKEDKSGKEHDATGAKVYRQEGEKKSEVADGVKGLKVGEKGVFATIETEGDKVTTITIGGGRKKKDAK